MVYIIGEAVHDLDDIIGRIREDKTNFLKNGDKAGSSVASVILGEVQRDPKKDYSDENITKILRGLRKMTLKSPEVDHLLIALVDTYIPPPVSDGDAMNWLFLNGYDKDTIKAMGKRAYSIMGMMKKAFDGREFNTSAIKDLIDEAIGED